MSLMLNIWEAIKRAVKAKEAAQNRLSREDAERVLAELAEKRTEKLNWRESIVDLLKLLELDSSMAARSALALELDFLKYTGSAADNIELHKRVMDEFAKGYITVGDKE